MAKRAVKKGRKSRPVILTPTREKQIARVILAAQHAERSAQEIMKKLASLRRKQNVDVSGKDQPTHIKTFNNGDETPRTIATKALNFFRKRGSGSMVQIFLVAETESVATKSLDTLKSHLQSAMLEGERLEWGLRTSVADDHFPSILVSVSYFRS